VTYQQYLQTDHWKEVRRMALEWAGYKCQVCNSPHELDVHHRTYERKGRERLQDLTVLCRSCHQLFRDRLPNEQKNADDPWDGAEPVNDNPCIKDSVHEWKWIEAPCGKHRSKKFALCIHCERLGEVIIWPEPLEQCKACAALGGQHRVLKIFEGTS
jgi:hypothetical protein